MFGPLTSVRVSIYIEIPICQSTFLSVYISICQSVSLPVWLSACLLDLAHNYLFCNTVNVVEQVYTGTLLETLTVDANT